MPETIAVAVHLDDVNAVSEPVQQSTRQPLGTEHLGPLVEWQVRCHEARASFAALAKDLKEQFRPSGMFSRRP